MTVLAVPLALRHIVLRTMACLRLHAQLSVSASGLEAEVGNVSGSMRAERTVVHGERVGIDVADGGSGLCFPMWRCRNAMALSKQWVNMRRMALNVTDDHGPVIFTSTISSATTAITVSLQPVFYVQRFPKEARQMVKLSNEPVIEEFGAGQFPMCTVAVDCST